MAQYSNLTKDFIPQATTNFEVVMIADAIGRIQSTNGDAFDRVRICQPFTLGDYKHVYGEEQGFRNITSNGGLVTLREAESSVRLLTSTANNSSSIHQSKLYHHYMPGKSTLVLCSFVMHSAVTNTTKRIGYFDNSDGIFFQQSGDGVLSFCIRSSVSGSVVDTVVSRNNWNIDRCDGNGFSNFTIDITKTQLFWCDFQWLGVGRVRCGFVHNGKFVVAHEFYHSNVLSTAYFSNPNLPIRSEIQNTGTSTGGFLDHICSTVVSEGGYIESGVDYSHTQTSLRTLAAGVTLPVLAIRLKNTFKNKLNRITVKLSNYSLISTGANCKFRLIKLPNQAALTNAGWSDYGSNSGIEYTEIATAFSGGEELSGGWVSASTQGSKQSGAPGSAGVGNSKKDFIVQNFDSTDSEIYALIVTNLSSADSTSVGASFQWREIY